MLQIWESIKSIFLNLRKRDTRNTCEFNIGSIFYITEGTYRNRFIVHTNKEEESLGFLLLPEAENIIIPYKDCTIGIESGLIQSIENLPKSIANTCITQYEQNQYSHNRRK